MDQTVAIITPVFNAQTTIGETVRSVLAQTHKDWQLWLVADDGFDYRSFLAEAGIQDLRIRFRSSGGIGTGACRTRNVALEAITTPYAALLDADDRFKPGKLEQALAALQQYPVVTTAIDVMTESLVHLRHVGHGPDRVLTPGTHKWVSLSMDSMVIWDRRVADGRFDPSLRNMNDLDFLLQLFRHVPQSLHLGTPLHDYIKRSGSLSNGADTEAGMIAGKTEILRRLASGHYGLSAGDVDGLSDFLAVSLDAEKLYATALAASPGLLFEDHLEPMLDAATAKNSRAEGTG